MADVHILHPRGVRSQHVDRLVAELQASMASGSNLGSRVPHIIACGARLQEMADQLAAICVELRPSLWRVGPEGRHADEMLTQYHAHVQCLADSAMAIPIEH